MATKANGRAVKDLAKLEAHPDTIRILTTAVAAFDIFAKTGQIPHVPGMSARDWALAERLLEGAA